MRKVIIVAIVISTLLAIGFGIWWKEQDQIWWFYAPWEHIYTINWIDVKFDIPYFDLGVGAWMPFHVVWQINLYNSWCLFMSLMILCFGGIVATLLATTLWVYLHPDPIYMYKSETQVWVSYNRGKDWEVEDFNMMKTACIHWSSEFRKCALGKNCAYCKTYEVAR